MINDKNSLFESGSSKKSRLIGLCDVWGWVTTYWAAADAAPSPSRLHPISPIYRMKIVMSTRQLAKIGWK